MAALFPENSLAVLQLVLISLSINALDLLFKVWFQG